MKVICSPDSFKDSLSARDAASAMARGILRAVPGAQIDQCPVADGGEGTVQTMVAATEGTLMTSHVQGPRGQVVDAQWGILGRSVFVTSEPLPANDRSRSAIIEMAAASGLERLAAHHRNPMHTSTFGTGQLILAALSQSVRRIIIGIGGSATNDGGCGMAQALGVSFYDTSGKLMTQPITGEMLTSIGRIDSSDLHPSVARTTIQVACDVTNPMTGSNGAAHIFAAQKGAGTEEMTQLENGLRHLARLVRRDIHIDVEQLPGSGAAGGLGGGLVAFCGAELQSGIELVLDAVQFAERVESCDLCLTGEGQLDGQTLAGKACLGVAWAAARHGVPTHALVGAAGLYAEKTLQSGLAGYHVIAPDVSPEQSMRNAAVYLENKTAEIMRSFQPGRK